MGKYSSKGFTLIELLITTTLLSMIMFVGSYSYSIFTTKWQTKLSSFDIVVEETISMLYLQSVLDGIVPVVVKNGRAVGFYFYGEENKLRAVSLNGLFTDSHPVVFELSMESKSNGEGRLVYKEVSTAAILISEHEQPIVFTHTFELLPNISQLSFQYDGWDSFETKAKVGFTGLSSHGQLSSFSQYNGVTKSLIPEKVTLTLKQSHHSMQFYTLLPTTSEKYLSNYLREEQ